MFTLSVISKFEVKEKKITILVNGIKVSWKVFIKFQILIMGVRTNTKGGVLNLGF